jgi:hypothetical protein
MRRRSFVKLMVGMAGLFAFGRPTLASEEMERVEYGAAFLLHNCFDTEMPQDLRAMLDERAAKISRALGRKIEAKEYIWLSAGVKDSSDPLGQKAYAGIKFWVLVPKSVVDAEFAAAGWVPYSTLAIGAFAGKAIELMDRRVNGRLVRFAREERRPSIEHLAYGVA